VLQVPSGSIFTINKVLLPPSSGTARATSSSPASPPLTASRSNAVLAAANGNSNSNSMKQSRIVILACSLAGAAALAVLVVVTLGMHKRRMDSILASLSADAGAKPGAAAAAEAAATVVVVAGDHQSRGGGGGAYAAAMYPVPEEPAAAGPQHLEARLPGEALPHGQLLSGAAGVDSLAVKGAAADAQPSGAADSTKKRGQVWRPRKEQ
jgi:hypothetical protein